jgi:hypothetical protein
MMILHFLKPDRCVAGCLWNECTADIAVDLFFLFAAGFVSYAIGWPECGRQKRQRYDTNYCCCDNKWRSAEVSTTH